LQDGLLQFGKITTSSLVPSCKTIHVRLDFSDAVHDIPLLWGRELWERFTVVMDRFHVSGWRRWYLVEPISEGITLTAGASVLALALAIPAFRETTEEDWLKASQLAVTFLDRYGNEVGTRGIRHNDSVPLDELPDHLIKAVLARVQAG
jgi:penicillin-binding protein 1A